MALLTTDGTLRGYGTRCADVTKVLQSVRALVSSKHEVCFGLHDGSKHVIINKMTGEINHMRDDGVNYLQELMMVPHEHIERVAAKLAALQLNPAEEQDFGRQGR